MNMIKIVSFSALYVLMTSAAFAQAGGGGGGGGGGGNGGAGGNPMSIAVPRTGGPIIQQPPGRRQPAGTPNVCAGVWAYDTDPGTGRTVRKCRLIYFY